ncbi:hypothetical protein CWE06_06555 [Aliidiomarina haloalkalitolerans]|uniref:YCII-related domain-containing protein n=2 Tax=Aliidiomarina haloalkalitolerans TaxID=859059 RepID=A0A432VUY5_9GAMM|nr:hypothetical protein CWE06_06555 [Aliidiomarina haloalkalitolerans]
MAFTGTRHFTIKAMLALLLFFCASISAQETSTKSTVSKDSMTNGYDEQLAAELGADDYGMRLYVLAFLETGDATGLSQEERMQLQRGHMATINQLANEGHLVLAGPFVNGGDLRGLYLFATSDVQEAQALAARDPAIQKGVFKLRMTQWYGSAALLTVPATHERIQKQQP